MILTIAGFEIRKRLRMVSTYVYFLLFFSLSFLVFIAAGGAFPGVVSISASGEKTWVNSPMFLANVISAVSFFGVITMAAIMGNATYQDFQTRIFSLFFTAPISKADYLIGRFLGSFLVLMFIFSSLSLGAFAASCSPFVEPTLFGPNRAAAYLHPYVIVVLPNLFFISTIFFMLAATVRKILPVYLASVLLLTGYLIASAMVGDPSNKYLAGILDPFGSMALSEATDYWSVSERNTQLVPLVGALLWNRVLWISVSLGVFVLTLFSFRFEYGGEPKWRIRQVKAAIREESPPLIAVPKTPVRRFRVLPNLLGGAWLNFKETVFNVYFSVILLAGVSFLILAAQQLGMLFGTETYPVTGMILQIIGGSFNMFVLIIITFYSGELVWRERDANVHQIYDAMPIPTWVPLASKILALIMVQVLLLSVLLLTSLAIQACMGYFHFELGLYLFSLFVPKLFNYALLSVLAIFIHVVVNNKYLGHFVMVLYYLMTAFLGRFGLEHHLYNYATTTGYPYSDMNGYGHFLTAVFWFDLYWGTLAAILCLVGYLFWVRGTDAGWRARLAIARERLSVAQLIPLALLLAAFAGIGSFIYYNTTVLNRFSTRAKDQALQAAYEKKYGELKKVAQPRVTDVRLRYDIDPYARQMRSVGELVLKNKTSGPIDTVYLNTIPELKVHQLALGTMEKPSETDEPFHFHTYKLPQALRPGEELVLKFDIEYQAKGFRNGADDTQVVYNGTFVNSGSLPSIGYQTGRELSEDKARKENGLAPKERMAEPTDMEARKNNYISSEADWVTLDAVVSTSPDQIAIVPGYLQKEWTENGRRFFHYKTEGKILCFFSVLSGRYEVLKDTWRGKVAFGKSDATAAAKTGDPLSGVDRDVSIEIYYHKGHEYNVQAMADGIKDSLDYFTKNFSPYQHRQARIIEFPRYATFAQAFPNTIPFSEGIGFIARVNPKDPKDLDYPYYVTAHEIAHQWWAHQVIGGAVKGATLLSETFAQYSALMVMKKKFGDPYMKRFLRFELDRYLIGRGLESKKEQPLAFNENQPYIHYNKGSLVMYALQDYLGEETVNKSLANFIRRVGYQDPPYTCSLEYLEELRKVTPADKQYLIQDLFETITLYDLRAIEASAVKSGTGEYEVTLKVKTRKLRSGELGEETEVTLSEPIEIGIYGKDDKVIYLEKKLIKGGESEHKFTVKELPLKAGIDPVNKLIDRKPDDNVIAVAVN